MNNIIWGNRPDQIASLVNHRVSHNLIEGNHPGIGNVSADPGFVDGDPLFHLSASSGCLGTGTDSLWIFGSLLPLPRSDFDGKQRPAPEGSRPDLGAQESSFPAGRASELLQAEQETVRRQSSVVSIVIQQTGHRFDARGGTRESTHGIITPTISIDGIIQPEAGTPSVTLPPGSNFLDLEIIHRNVPAPAQVRDYTISRMFQTTYWLKGVDQRMFQTSTSLYTCYVDVKPGSYTLILHPSDANQYFDIRNAVSINVEVLPWWWQRPWAQSLFVVIVGIGVLMFSRREIRRLRSEKLIQQEFSQRQMESQEVERKRLASELHDGLGQNLLIASNELQQYLRQGDGPREGVQQASQLIQESIQSAREMASNLHPHQLERLGFCAAVRSMTEQISHANHFPVSCSCDNVDQLLMKDVRLQAYRIIQEALANVVHHASATKAGVEVRKGPGGIEVIIRDDGAGFAVADERSRGSGDTFRGFGLASMAQRAIIVGGTLKIDSSPGKGTTVSVTIPSS